MCNSGAFTQERAENRFKTIHSWIPYEIVHMPTILVKDIQEYPNIIEFIKEESHQKLRMFPEIHGYEHIDYSVLSETEISEHLKLCIDWFKDVLKLTPAIWAPPWGNVGSLAMQDASRKLGLRIQGVEKTVPPKVALEILKIHPTANLTVLAHWWEKGHAIKRICKIVEAGSYDKASELDKENLF